MSAPIPASMQKPKPDAADSSATALKGAPINLIPGSLNEPLNSKYCLYFSLLSQFAVITGILAIGTMLYTASKYDMKLAIMVVTTVAMYLLMYFSNRLLYSMCAGALSV